MLIIAAVLKSSGSTCPSTAEILVSALDFYQRLFSISKADVPSANPDSVNILLERNQYIFLNGYSGFSKINNANTTYLSDYKKL